MHILEFKAYYKPEVAAGIEIDCNTAEDLAAHGHYVHLYIPQPSRGISKDVAKSVPKREILQNGKLIIYRYGMYDEGKSFKQRFIRYCFCSLKQLWHGLREKNIDLIFAGSTPPFQGVVCSWIKKIKKVPFVYNCQDIFPESMISTGMLHDGGLLCRIGNRISEITFKSADQIIVISEEMKNTLINKNVPKEKIEVVYNWVDEKVIHPVERKNNLLINELNIPEYDFFVVYAGNIGYAQGIDILLDAADFLKEDDRIGFIIFGNGAMENDVKNQIEKRNLSNIYLYPLQPYNRVSEVYSLGDACVVSCKPGTGCFAMPSKTWSIMGCGRAVLASFDRNTLLEKIITENNCGLFNEAGDTKSFVENILKLVENRNLCDKQGNNSRIFIEQNLSRKMCTEKINSLIERAAQNNK